jgi:hypothetical protein
LEAVVSLLTRLRAAIAGATLFLILFVASLVVWLMGARNPYTPAGYVGYLTKGAFFGQSRFYGVQRGPCRRAAAGSSTSPTSA